MTFCLSQRLHLDVIRRNQFQGAKYLKGRCARDPAVRAYSTPTDTALQQEKEKRKMREDGRLTDWPTGGKVYFSV